MLDTAGPVRKCISPFRTVEIGDAICHYVKEGNVLFNDALNTFYFTVIWRQTYG